MGTHPEPETWSKLSGDVTLWEDEGLWFHLMETLMSLGEERATRSSNCSSPGMDEKQELVRLCEWGAGGVKEAEDHWRRWAKFTCTETQTNGRKLCLESSSLFISKILRIYNAKIPWFWESVIQHSLLLRFSEFCFLVVDEFTFLGLWMLGIWSLPVLGHPSASMGGAGKKYLEQKRPHAFALQSAFQLDPVFSALGKETKENADRAPASTNESFPWAEWMPSPVQPPGQHQHWVNTETNLCEIKTHFYMVPWHQDRHFLPTKQAQLSCYALWPLLLKERVANSLNPFRAPRAGDRVVCMHCGKAGSELCSSMLRTKALEPKCLIPGSCSPIGCFSSPTN